MPAVLAVRSIDNKDLREAAEAKKNKNQFEKKNWQIIERSSDIYYTYIRYTYIHIYV